VQRHPPFLFRGIAMRFFSYTSAAEMKKPLSLGVWGSAASASVELTFGVASAR
jgi:hypothetical protein